MIMIQSVLIRMVTGSLIARQGCTFIIELSLGKSAHRNEGKRAPLLMINNSNNITTIVSAAKSRSESRSSGKLPYNITRRDGREIFSLLHRM